jgi:hypothetical protein
MLLCEAAQSVGGKLYILGGGFSRVLLVQPPITMALAVHVGIPWTEANQPYDVTVSLLNVDSTPVQIAGQPIRVEARLEVGRPPGLQHGTPLDNSFVFNFDLPLSPGTYVWRLEMRNAEMDTPVSDEWRFEVVGNQPARASRPPF